MKFSRVGTISAALFLLLQMALPGQGASLRMSIGIRETGNPNNQAIGTNGGSANGIEFVNRDGQTLNADGTWQLFTFTPATDTLTAFAGTTANSALDDDWGTLEMIRIGNVADGVTRYRVWIDDITNTTSAGAVNFGDFEAAALNTEVIFQEPRFSGSTTGNLQLLPNASLVTNSMAHAGTQSNQVDFEFLDDTDVTGTPSRWVRLTTSNTPNLPNPLVRLRESVAGGVPLPTTITFWAKAVVIPEPSSLALVAFGLVTLPLVARRRAG